MGAYLRYRYYTIIIIITDLDECVNSSYHNRTEAENEICHNTVGSFTCECLQIFDLNISTKICEGEEEKKKGVHFFKHHFCLFRY